LLSWKALALQTAWSVASALGISPDGPWMPPDIYRLSSPCPISLVERAVQPPYQRDAQFLLRVHRKPDGFQHEILHIQEFDSEPFITRRILRTVHPGLPWEAYDVRQTGLIGKRAHESAYRRAKQKCLPKSMHYALIAPIRAYANSKYGIRREEWPGPFVDGMATENTNIFLNDTIGIESFYRPTQRRVTSLLFYLAPYAIRDGVRVPEGHFVEALYGNHGTFRPLSETDPDDALPRPPEGTPENKLLNIEYLTHPFFSQGATPGSAASFLEAEIAAYVVEENPHLLPIRLRSAAWTELFVQLLLTVFDNHAHRHLSLYGKFFHAPADRKSQILYRSMQLHAQRNYRQNGREKHFPFPEVPPEIEAAQVRWLPMGFLPLRILELANRLAFGTPPHFLHHFDSAAYRRRIETVGLGEMVFSSHNPPLRVESLDAISDPFRKFLNQITISADDCLSHRLAIERFEKNAEFQKEELQAARSALEIALNRTREYAEQLPTWTTHSDELVRAEIAKLAMDLAFIRHTEPTFLNKTFLLQKLLIPLLSDPSDDVRFWAVYGLRHAFTRDDILSALYGKSAEEIRNPHALIASGREKLIGLGMTDTEIDWWDRAFKGYIAYDSSEPNLHHSRTFYQDIKDRADDPRFRTHPELMEIILLNATLDSVPLEERASNIVPMDF
jgi:hypothetical protein